MTKRMGCQKMSCKCMWDAAAKQLKGIVNPKIKTLSFLLNMLKIYREEKNMLIKLIILISFAHVKYSRCFIKIQLNRYEQMDHFNDVLVIFWTVTERITMKSMRRPVKLSNTNKHIFICVMKMLGGLEMCRMSCGGVKNYIFGLTIPFL